MARQPRRPDGGAPAATADGFARTFAAVAWPDVFGFALVQTWTVLCIALPDPVTYGEPFLDLRWLSLLTAAALSLAAGLLPALGGRLARDLTCFAAVAALSAVSSLLGPVSALFNPPLSGALLHLAAVGVGCGFAWLYLAWYDRFCRRDDTVGVAASVVVSLCLTYPLANVLSTDQISPWVSAVAGSLLPVAAAALFAFAPPANGSEPACSSAPVSLRSLEPSKRRLLARMGICLLMVLAVVETTRNYLLGGTAIGFYAGVSNLGGVVLKVACAVWLAHVFAGRDARGVSIAYRLAFVLLLAVVLCVPLLLQGNWHAHMLLDVASFFFQIVMLMVACQMCVAFALPPAQTFGLGRTIWAAGTLAGIGLEALRGVYGTAFVSLLPVLLGLTAAVAFLFVFTDRDCVEVLASLPASDAVPGFDERAALLAHRSGVSDRELEVMLLVAKGRSAARIAEMLEVSQATVNSHIYHVYQKLDVHSRQELIDAIEREEPAGR